MGQSDIRLTIVRHGETEENARSEIQGHAPGNLSARGIRQATALGNRLSGVSFSTLYSSDLRRALHTAEILGQLLALNVVPTVELRERKMGRFEGRTSDEFLAALQNSPDGPFKFRPEGGESLNDLYERAQRFFSSARNWPDGHYLLVSHGAFIRALLCVAANQPVTSFFEFKQDNCCLNELVVAPESITILTANCTAHISPSDLNQRSHTAY